MKIISSIFLLAILSCKNQKENKTGEPVISAHDSTIAIRSAENKKNAGDTIGRLKSIDYNFLCIKWKNLFIILNIDENEWDGEKNPQLRIVDLQPSDMDT